MDHTKCIKCKAETKIVIGSLPGQGYQVGFLNECGECGYVDWLLINEDEFEVKFDDTGERITFELKGAIEQRL